MDNVLVDIGGTHIRIGIGEDVHQPFSVLKTPSDREELLNLLQAEITRIIKERNIDATKIYISCPGLVDKHGKINKILYVSLEGVNLVDEIARRMGKEAIVINDANIQGLGCYNKNSLLYMNIGTAIGGSFVCDNRLFLGNDGFSCEFGHVFIGNEQVCNCGRVGCLDTVASGWCFVEKFGENWWNRADDSDIQEQLKIAGRAVGDALAQISILFNPKEICVTGRVSIYGIFKENVREEYYNKSWYNIPIIFKKDSWQNVYFGFKKIIKGEYVI